MKNVFMPYYINSHNIKNLFQIAINRFGNIDIDVNTVNTTIELNVPLSEITCGKIAQGSAKISIARSNIRGDIDFETKACIDAFINLENILHKNNSITTLTSTNLLKNLYIGDIVEITATISQIDPILNFYEKTLNLLEFQQITENIDNSNLILWITNNIETIVKEKKIKFSATPNFATDTNIIISLDSKNSIIDVDYYLERPVTIVGQIMSSTYAFKNNNITPSTNRPFAKDFSKDTIFGDSLKDFPLTNHGETFNLNAHLLWDYLNSDKRYFSFLNHLNYPINKTSKNKTIEILPLMIYL